MTSRFFLLIGGLWILSPVLADSCREEQVVVWNKLSSDPRYQIHQAEDAQALYEELIFASGLSPYAVKSVIEYRTLFKVRMNDLDALNKADPCYPERPDENH